MMMNDNSRKIMRKYSSFSALVVGLGASDATFAQQYDSDAQTLDTITVTSQGRTEELQKAAAPIAVFSEVRIQDAGITSTSDFVRLVPNMSFDTSFTIGNSYTTMRGIMQRNNIDSPVTIVVDGVPQNNQKEFKMDLFDIEQIEVLRGPQGGLYGRNSVAGAVIINTKQPGNYHEGFAQIGMGDHGLRKLSGSTSGPLIEDRLFYRFSLSASDYDGAIMNTYLNEPVDFYRGHDMRGQIKWLPRENQELDWRITRSKLRGGAYPDLVFLENNTNNSNIWGNPIGDILGTSARLIEGSSLKYKWDGQAMSVTSVTGYTHIFEDFIGDLDICNPVVCPNGFRNSMGQIDGAQILKVYQLSQEIRLSSPQDAPIQWTAGAFLLDTRRKLRGIFRLLETVPIRALTDTHETNQNRAWAVFGQVQFPFGDWDRVELSVRLDHDRRRQSNVNTGELVRERSWSAWQPKITWSHDLSDTRMLYATAGRGFRSGGFNGIGGLEFDPEVLTSYEVGYKSSWLDNRITFNSALFYQYDKNYQFQYLRFLQGTTGQVISNLKRVEIAGLESELNWRVRSGWEIFASLGLLGTRVKETGELSTPLPIVNGLRVPRTEPYDVVLGSQWNFPLGAYRGMFRFDVSRKGTRTWEPDNIYLMDPVTLVNTRFTFFSNSQWNMTVWATNLFDHHYYGDFNSNSYSFSGRDSAVQAPGRRYGMDFRYNF